MSYRYPIINKKLNKLALVQWGSRHQHNHNQNQLKIIVKPFPICLNQLALILMYLKPILNNHLKGELQVKILFIFNTLSHHKAKIQDLNFYWKIFNFIMDSKPRSWASKGYRWAQQLLTNHLNKYLSYNTLTYWDYI